MSVRTVLVVFLAVLSGVSAAIGVSIWQKAQGGPRSESAKSVEVVVADKNIPRFTVITRDLLRTQSYPKELVPNGSFTDLSELEGRVAVSQLQAGEVLLDGKISGKGAGRGMAVAVPTGMRAFTIRTPNIASGVAGFILPGNKVDVLLTLVDSRIELTGGAVTTTLLQNLEVLAVDQVIDAPNGNKVDPTQLRSVTLLVSPPEAAQLELGQDKGSLHLSLRNHGDTATVTTRPITLREIQHPDEKPVRDLPLSVLAEATLPLPREVEPPPVEVLPAPRVVLPLPPIRTLRGVDESQIGVW